MTRKKIYWRKYLIEFMSVFIGVTLAFTLNKCNEDRKEDNSEFNTLLEIRNGLNLDLKDLRENKGGHQLGIYACSYFRDFLNDKPVNRDSLAFNYFYLMRNFISIQNKSAYESLKSRGLEIIKDDSLRLEIISLYDFHYEILEKMEENYSEMQYYQRYFHAFNDVIAPYMIFDESGNLVDIQPDSSISASDKNRLFSYLWRIEKNREYMIRFYSSVENEINELIFRIDEEANR